MNGYSVVIISLAAWGAAAACINGGFNGPAIFFMGLGYWTLTRGRSK